MPANLPPPYHDAEDRYRSATTVEEKLAALEEMLRIMPKHKGTDKLQADLKSRMAKLRKQPQKKGATRAFSHHIPREGAGQIALVGPPNAGKSALVHALTHAEPEVAAYPFTTRKPQPGMMAFEDIAFQLVDLPPVCEEHVEPFVYDLIRAADMLWLVLDIDDPIDGYEQTVRLLEAKKILMLPIGVDPPEERVQGASYRKTLMVLTGLDRPGVEENLEILDELIEAHWPRVAVSTTAGTALDDLRKATFDAMNIVRVYTKQPGKPADREQPFTLRRGATVEDLARTIHKEIADKLKFARIWGADVFDGQTVQREHVLGEGDVVEIHA
jgi:ribosome-interacting GTPase 1